MKIVFVSNFFNHHQKPLSDSISAVEGVDYHFIETAEIDDERLNLGWGGGNKPSYVMNNYNSEQSKKKCQELIDSADIAIIGSAPLELMKKRLKEKKLTFLYTERIYKRGYENYKWPLRLVRHFFKYSRYKSFYLLCASAYASADFARTCSFVNKAYKWGYFTELIRYKDIDLLIEEKETNSLLWTARFIPLKHPEIPVEIARRLKAEGYKFQMRLIGNGAEIEKIEHMVSEYGLEDEVHFLGAMSPGEVRSYMEKSEIFLFTSDRNEGWGAVVNEAMNSGCAVIASHTIGSVPFLINHMDNGLVFKSEDIDSLYKEVIYLIENSKDRKRISRNAYKTIQEEWNAEEAAKRLLRVTEALLKGETTPKLFLRGPCSIAQKVDEHWFGD